MDPDENAVTLQRRVQFDVRLYLLRRGLENIHKMKKTDFEVRHSKETNLYYVTKVRPENNTKLIFFVVLLFFGVFYSFFPIFYLFFSRFSFFFFYFMSLFYFFYLPLVHPFVVFFWASTLLPHCFSFSMSSPSMI